MRRRRASPSPTDVLPDSGPRRAASRTDDDGKGKTKGLEALAGLPNWPLMLTAHRAAAYVGLDPDVFVRAVEADEMPKPFLLQGQELWNRRKIDRHLDDPASPAVGAVDAITDALSRWTPR